MKFPLSWLRDHWEGDTPLDQIVETLSAIGLEVEGVEDRGKPLEAFRTARIVEAAPHPNADRLQVCMVDSGFGLINVVCGAPNARTGLHAVLARPGAVIPATGAVLKAGEIRGVKSEGMLCSSRELGLGEEHDGIIELPEGTAPGLPVASVLGIDDPVIEISVTPNRGDCLAVRGVARDLAAAGHGRLKPWSAEPVSGRFASPITWVNEFPTACPWVLGRAVRGVKNGPSPKWLADRLIAIGLRPINALADITNYFCVDLGRPLHVFDAAKIAGGKLTLRPGRSESFRGLNGKDYVADPEDCVIADTNGVVSLAGVLGGASTGCDDTTTEVFIECALFDPVRVTLTGRRHQIVSDARQRFERGVDPSFLPDALEAATRMVMELCGGEPSTTSVAGGEPPWQREASLRFARLAGFGGAEIAPDEAVRRLERLGFAVERRSAERVDVAVPPWRNDIASSGLHRGAGGGLDQAPGLDPVRAANAAAGALQIEPEADLIEEVLRLSGLDAIPPVSLPLARVVPEATLSPKQVRTALARRTLAAGGLLETVGFSFVAKGQESLFGDAPASLRLQNPIAEDLDQLRSTPVVSLALAAHRAQARGLTGSALFEIGPGFEEAEQRLIAATLRAGVTGPSWIDHSRAPDAYDAKGDVMAVLAALGLPMESLSVTTDAPGFYHPGRSGVVRQGPKLVLARFGELHPRVRTALGLDQAAVAAEVFLDAIPEPKKRRKAPPDISPLQPVRRDFAFVVAADVTAEALLRAARGAERGLIAGVSLFDVYEGLADGKKSLAIEVVLQPREKSLTDAEIEAVAAKIVAAVGKATGAVLR